jgi:hypothetical protein
MGRFGPTEEFQCYVTEISQNGHTVLRGAFAVPVPPTDIARSMKTDKKEGRPLAALLTLELSTAD